MVIPFVVMYGSICMNRVKVKVDKNQLAYFRRLARSSPLEVHAYLVGEIVSPGFVKVDYFAYPAEYKLQTSESVQWYADELDTLRKRVISENLVVVGDIHSHPQWDAVMSPADHAGAIVDSLRICGVCSVYGQKTRVRFWVPDSALPCEIVYK